MKGWIKKTAKKEYLEAKRKIFGSKGVKGRYGIGKGKGGFKIAQLAADLEAVKNRLNVEKKHKDVDVYTGALGQCSANSEGALKFDVTPVITQGVGGNQRVGNSLKLTGISIPMSFTQQVKCRGDRKVRLTLVRVRAADNSVSTGEAFDKIFDVNPLNGLRDYNCPRAYRNSKTDGISIIRTKIVYVKGPTIENQGAQDVDTERNVTNLRFNVKLNDILRFVDSSQSEPDGVRYYLFAQINAGNANVVDSTLDVPVTNGSTGTVIRLSQRNWWVDN